MFTACKGITFLFYFDEKCYNFDNSKERSLYKLLK